ncbi:DUF423 domain-containing protein [Kordia zhangzhouensis]|uniref:DUF423 domain-containing protein n=1 Tax=Kordia zhangzhouensis TaxID=1620405 RepID=UPI000629578F|nr:DUF423 domain-containing protein [Kordia zhangzhouensis]
MKTIVLIAATFYGASGIIVGAFGAHALKKIFSDDLQKSFETGVKYQLYHAIVLLILGFELSFVTDVQKSVAWCFIIGTFLFSFSIYGLCISSVKGKKLRFLGPITPLGGLLLVVAWILLGISFS